MSRTRAYHGRGRSPKWKKTIDKVLDTVKEPWFFHQGAKRDLWNKYEKPLVTKLKKFKTKTIANTLGISTEISTQQFNTNMLNAVDATIKDYAEKIAKDRSTWKKSTGTKTKSYTDYNMNESETTYYGDWGYKTLSTIPGEYFPEWTNNGVVRADMDEHAKKNGEEEAFRMAEMELSKHTQDPIRQQRQQQPGGGGGEQKVGRREAARDNPRENARNEARKELRQRRSASGGGHRLNKPKPPTPKL